MIHCDQMAPPPRKGERSEWDGWHGINRKWLNHVASIQNFLGSNDLTGAPSRRLWISAWCRPVTRAHRECIWRFLPLISSICEIKRNIIRRVDGRQEVGGFGSSPLRRRLNSGPILFLEGRLLGVRPFFSAHAEWTVFTPPTDTERLTLLLFLPASTPPWAKRTPWST